MILLLLVLLLIGWAPVSAQAADEVQTEHVSLRLLSEQAVVKPGETFWVGLQFELIPHWHVYWRNPGDSGTAPRIDWQLPPGWQAGEIRWPLPERIHVGPLTNYGYTEAVTLLVPIEVSTEAAPSATVTIQAQSNWLVCREACVPEQGTVTQRIAVGADNQVNTAVNRHFEQVRRQLPTALPGQARFRVVAEQVELELSGLDGAGEQWTELWFAPWQWGPVSPSGEQRRQTTASGFTLVMPVGDSPPRQQLNGLLVVSKDTAAAERRGFQIRAQPVSARADAGRTGLVTAVLLALLGGVLLNLMPCVLPVLAMKAVSLANLGQRPMRHGGQGMLFTAGVLSTFTVLALVLLGLRSAGMALGWGFQLQSPPVVAALMYLMLLIGLNLSGAFEVGQRLMGFGQHRASPSGPAGALLTGVLAVLVASPCTAPFMGAALGYAVTQPVSHALPVFLALGLGFALPMLLLTIWPGWTRYLPRPGAWMLRLRRLLAFPMYATAAWLLWVLTQQTTAAGLAAVLAGSVLVAGAAWLYGEAAQGWRFARWPSAICGLTALLLLPLSQAGRQAEAASDSQTWRPARVAALRAEERPVFVNFTAAWCITCQVNERVAIATPRVQAAFREAHVAYLKADWTNREPRITAALARYDRSGVPLYLLYPPGEGAPRVLPQLLTPSIILNALSHTLSTAGD